MPENVTSFQPPENVKKSLIRWTHIDIMPSRLPTFFHEEPIDLLLNKQRNFRMSNANQTADRNFEQHQNGKEQIDATDASTNAFPGGFQAIATAYGDYTKKSFE